MTVGEFISQAVASSTIATILVSAVAWYWKTWASEVLKNQISNEYASQLETHKNKIKYQSDTEIERLKSSLKAQADVEVERLKSNLSIAAAERQVLFSNLHQRRADVIAELYSKLKAVNTNLEKYTAVFEPAGGASREERRAAFSDSHKSFLEFYTPKQIFIPEETAKKIDEINIAIVRLSNEFFWSVDGRPNFKASKWLQITNEIDTKIRSAVVDLEAEFRLLLGDAPKLNKSKSAESALDDGSLKEN